MTNIIDFSKYQKWQAGDRNIPKKVCEEDKIFKKVDDLCHALSSNGLSFMISFSEKNEFGSENIIVSSVDLDEEPAGLYGPAIYWLIGSNNQALEMKKAKTVSLAESAEGVEK